MARSTVRGLLGALLGLVAVCGGCRSSEPAPKPAEGGAAEHPADGGAEHPKDGAEHPKDGAEHPK